MKTDREKKKVQVFDLDSYKGKHVRICFLGGIEMSGYLKSHDKLLNIILENAKITNYPPNIESEAKEVFSQSIKGAVCKGASICSIELLEEEKKK